MDIEKIKKARPLIAVVVILVILGIIFIPKLFVNNKVITASGTVEVREVDVSSRIASRVTSLKVDEGAIVKKGDLLATLDDSIVAAQKSSAEAVYENALDTYNRNKNLILTQSISQQQFDLIKSEYISAMRNLNVAQIMLNESNVIAPWDGVILKKHVEEGELLSASTPLFTLGDVGTAKVTIYVPLIQVGILKYGQKAYVMIDSFSNKKFEGKITFISSEAEFTPKNVQTQDERVKEVFEIEVTVPNPDYVLKPGIPADVEIPIQ